MRTGTNIRVIDKISNFSFKYIKTLLILKKLMLFCVSFWINAVIKTIESF